MVRPFLYSCRRTSHSSLAVRFGFLNGTTDGAFGSLSYHSLFGSNSLDTDLTTLVSTLEVRPVPSLTAPR